LIALRTTGLVMLSLVASLSVHAANGPAPAAAAASPPPSGAPSAPANAGVADTPQQTTATFGDWVLRCEHPAGAPALCEVVQTTTNQGRPVAQVAIGRAAHGQPLHLTILVPPDVSLGQTPQLVSGTDKLPGISLVWRRCLPGGCLADSGLTDDGVLHLRSRTTAAQVTFQDAAGRTVSLPFSPRGLSQALDALAKDGGS
jgi:invasion protein IalB